MYDIFFDADAPPLDPILEVEEDGVEAEEDEAHGGHEPAVGLSLESRLVNPYFGSKPLLRDAESRDGIGVCAEESDEGCATDDDGEVTDGRWEAGLGDGGFEEDGVDEARWFEEG